LPATVEDDIESFNAAEPHQVGIAPASGPAGRSSGEAVLAMEPAAAIAAVALDTEPAKEAATAGDGDNALLPAAARGTAVAGEPLQQIGEAAAAVPPDDDLADDKPEEASPPARDGDRAVNGQAALADPAIAPPTDGAGNGQTDTVSQPAVNAPTGSAPTAPTLNPQQAGHQRLLSHGPLVADGQPSTEPRAIMVDAARLIHRVARAFAAAGEVGGEVRLRLSPPELGALRLDVRVQEGVLVARLETETATARTAIIDNLPALRERLAEQGVRIERFDVDLMQRQPGGTPDRPADHRPPEQSVPPAVHRGRRFPQVAEGVVAPSRRLAELDPRRINVVI
jgi:flagellar hook-length control protein FliK